jgi:hypothetical protein
LIHTREENSKETWKTLVEYKEAKLLVGEETNNWAEEANFKNTNTGRYQITIISVNTK